MVACYCVRVECDKVAQHLRDRGIKAEAYHAGLSDSKRNNVQLRWIREDDCKVGIIYFTSFDSCISLKFCLCFCRIINCLCSQPWYSAVLL